MSLRRRRWLAALSLLGVGIAGYLSWVKFSDSEAVCGGLGDCSGVQNSIYAYLLGVPVAYLGLLVYLALAALALYSLYAPGGGDDWLAMGLFILSFGGFIFSTYLTYTELFLIHAICPWCVASLANLTALTILTAGAVFASPGEDRIP